MKLKKKKKGGGREELHLVNLTDLWWLIVSEILAYSVGTEGQKVRNTPFGFQFAFGFHPISLTTFMSVLRKLKPMWLWYHDVFVKPYPSWKTKANGEIWASCWWGRYYFFLKKISCQPHLSKQKFLLNKFSLCINNHTSCYSFLNLTRS